MKADKRRELRIEKLVFQGDGLGHDGGRAVFVPLTAPGDVITWKPLRKKKRFVRGQLLNVMIPSPDRVPPPCPLFGRCGGCQWLHLRYTAQLRWKQAIVEEIFERADGIRGNKVRKILPSPLELHYRARARLSIGPEGVGFYGAKSHQIVSIRQCPLFDDRLNRILTLLGKKTKGPFGDRVRGELLLECGDRGVPRAIFRPQPSISKRQRQLREVLEELTSLAEAGPFSLYLDIPGGMGPELLAGDDLMTLLPVEGMNVELSVPPGGFFQANLEQNRRLYGLLMRALKEEGMLFSGVKVLDLFCGMGNFSIPLAHRGCEVTGVDNTPASIDAARRNVAAYGGLHMEFVCANAAAYLQKNIRGREFAPDVLILDPPRTGAREVVETLVGLEVFPKMIAYVSCDPMTLVRDLKYLTKDALYEVLSVTPVDLFPQTFHIETLTVLKKN